MNLKELLTNRQVDFVIDWMSPVMDLPKKTGGTYQAHEAKIRTTSNGEVYDARFFPTFGATVKAGDTIQGKLNNAGYPDFRKVESGEPRNNYQEVHKEREIASMRDIKTKKEIAIGLRGLYQAHVSAGRNNQEALHLALEADAMIEKAAQTMFDNQQ